MGSTSSTLLCLHDDCFMYNLQGCDLTKVKSPDKNG